MKKIIFLITMIYALGMNFLNAQTEILMHDGTETITCGDTYIFKDAGGDDNYPSNQDVQLTITSSSPDMAVQVTFNEFFIENNWDKFKIYQGTTTAASQLIGVYTNHQLEGEVILSEGSSLTFVFQSDGYVNKPGWVAEITCVYACQEFSLSTTVNGDPFPDTLVVCLQETFNLQTQGNYPNSGINYDQNDANTSFVWDLGDGTQVPGTMVEKTYSSQGMYTITLTVTDVNNCVLEEEYLVQVLCGGDCPECHDFYPGEGTVHACSGIFWDSGGSGDSYENGENETITFCSDNGGMVRLNFVLFQLDNTNNDHLYVYDGPDVNSPLIGNYTMDSPMSEPFVSSGTCLTVKFTSSFASNPGIGWKALVSCTAPCQEVDLGLMSTPALTEDNIIYTCPENDVNLLLNLSFPENGTYYNQSASNTAILWSSTIGLSSSSSLFTYPIDSAFTSSVFLDVLDVNGCHTYDTIKVISECQEIDVTINTDAVQEQSDEVFLPVGEPIHLSASYAFPESGSCYNQTLEELTWTFGLSDVNTGDVIESHAMDTTITYNESGVYEVILTVSDQKGCEKEVVKEIHVGCQPIDVSWTGSPAMLGDTIIVCPGEPFSVEITTDYFANNQPYYQADSIMTFNWNLADGTLINGQMNPGEHTYQSAGMYQIYLQIIDTNAGFNVPCVDNTFIPVYSFAKPSLEKTKIYVDTICMGDTILLHGKTTLEMPTYSAPPLFLPDGSGVSYSSTLTFDMFGDKTLTELSEFMGICMTLEHSYVGDLEIQLECPNGQTVEILPYPNNCGNNHFGEPCDIPSSTTTTGNGYEYCFTPGATSTIPENAGQFSHTFTDNDGNDVTDQSYFPAGDYLPTGNFNSLIGCPLNGDWTVIITDNLGSDDGMIFDWNIGFDTEGLIPPDTVQLPVEMREWISNEGNSEIHNINGDRAYALPLDSGLHSFTFTVTSPAGCSYDTVVGPIYVGSVPEWDFERYKFICGEMTYTIEGELTGGDGDWTYSGPGNAVFSDEHSIPTTVTVDTYGNYKFFFTPNTIPLCASPDSVLVAFHETPTVDVLIDSVDCYGSCDGSATVTPTGQELPYSYAWSNSETTATAGGLCTGEVHLTVSTNFCSNEYTYNIPSPTDVNIVNTTTVDNPCFGDSNGEAAIFVAGGSPPYSYAWSPANVSANSNTISNLPKGTYQVTVSDANNCSKSTSLTINEPDAPLTINYMTAYDVNCYEAADGSIDLNVIGGTAPYIYHWELSDGSSTSVQDPSGLDVGTHYVTVTDAHNCITTGNQNLSQPTELLISYNTVEPSCYGYSDGKAWVETHNATPPYQYQWSTGWTDSSIVNSPAASYSVTVTDSKGCQKEIPNVTVNQPGPVTVGIADVEPICIGGTATLTMSVASSPFSPYKYYWNGALSTESIVVDPLVTTTYIGKVVDSHGCESNEVSTEVQVYDPIEASITLSHTTVCEGASVTVKVDAEGGSPNTEYLLSDGTLVSDSFTVQPYETMEYRLIVKDDCSTPPDTIPFTITVEEPPVPSFNASVRNGCDPLIVNFTQDISSHEQGTKYLWTFSDGENNHISTSSSPQYIFSEAGLHNVSLEVTNSLGCKSSILKRDYIRVFPLPKASFTTVPNQATTVNPVIFFENNTEGAEFCLWNFGDEDTTSAWDISHTYPNIERDYLVTLTATTKYGCIDSVSKNISIVEEVTFYLPNAFTPDNDNINDVFKPEFNGISKNNYLMLIYDRWGSKIFETTDSEEGWDGTLNGKYVQPGMYRYIIKFVDVEGTPHEKSGNLNLIR